MPPPPPDPDLVSAQAGGNTSSSDFVRKLYKMLEDPSYNQVVRWSDDGDSFVVLENEKFTKTILPKHFKHSNFASFVRQLNKYDFHKVRHNDESGETPYGRDAWEFRHPEFRADRKDNLDNIRRKAPAPRKPQQVDEAFPASQQIAVFGETLQANQHQIQSLQDSYNVLSHANKVLVSEIANLQKMLKAQTQLSHELLTYLNNIDDRRRNSRHSAHSNYSAHSTPSFPSGSLGLLPDSADEPAPELRRAREILSNISPDHQAEREFERLSVSFHQAGSPPDSATSSSVTFSQPSSAPMPLLQDPLSQMVYPVGQTAGIDPFHSDHINNIPYSRPLSNPSPMVEAPSQITPSPLKDRSEQLWGGKKPKILLVEDDKTCSRIGAKFLSYADCELVDVARDGLDAVNKVNLDNNYYDLIFMDIIMPQLDGVSATSLIRMVAPRVPIIAMTANIRREDISMYFQYGMNDVLAKPFTKDGMLRILKRHLSFMLKDPPPPGMFADEMPQNGGAVGPGPPGSSSQQFGGQGTMNLATIAGPSLTPSGQVKFEQTPIQSPATSASWHSPGQLSQTSPNLEGTSYMTAVGSGPGGMVMTPGGTHPAQYASPVVQQMGKPPLSRGSEELSHGEERPPDKRQRLYGPSPGQFVQ